MGGPPQAFATALYISYQQVLPYSSLFGVKG